VNLAFDGSVEPADRAAGPFVYLPFDVPAGTTLIHVRYHHDDGHILDLGLFDPAVSRFPSRGGFRGWSGGARREFQVATDRATPGYLPGEIAAGRWQVVLGLAKVGPGRCRYRVEITLDDSPRTLVGPSRRSTPPRTAPGWYRGDLHCHTHHSDARGSLADLAAAAAARNLDFLAVTDHNTDSHHRDLGQIGSPDLLLVPGLEVTTYRGHANVWGVDGWVDFRIVSEADLPVLIDHVHERGGLISVNHPKTQPGCIGCDWEYPVPEGVDCLEAWQGPWLNRNWESLERYDALLRAGRRVTLVGGSDRHQPGWPDTDPEILQVGSPTTWLQLNELSSPAVLGALRAGRVWVSESPDGPALEIFVEDRGMGEAISAGNRQKLAVRATVKGAAGDLLRWIDASGVRRETPIEGDSFSPEWRWPADGPFLRAEIVARTGLERREAITGELARSGKLPRWIEPGDLERPAIRALSNPVYRSNF
jgi:hypothetical protein